MANQTRDAVKRYTAFLPEHERDVLLADCEAASEAAPNTKVKAAPATKQTGGAPRIQNTKWTVAELRTLLDEFNMPGATKTYLGKKHGVPRQRIATLLTEAKAKFSSYNKPKSPFDISQLTGITKNKGQSY